MSTTPCYTNIIYGPSVTTEPLNYTDNAVIPLTGRPRLLSKVVYGDDEVQVLYHEHTLEVEAVIYNETHTGPVDDVEAEVSRLRSILSTPALQLSIYPVALGEIGVINVDQMDVKGGPFPQDVSVESLASNNAILVRWAVMFRTIPGCEGSVLSSLLQYNVEQDMNVDDDGNMEFTLNITYQSSTPISNPQALFDISNVLIRRAGKSFQGMRKKKRSSMSRDQRILSIRLVYKEIESDSAFFPYTSNIQINDELESSLLGSSAFSGKGFYTWRRTIGGTIKLPPRIHKAYAWYVFLVILRERFKNLRLIGKISSVLGTTPPASQPQNAEVQQTNWYLPLKIRLTNPIYSRDMRFECTYVVVTDLDSLIDTTGIFTRVNVDEDDETPVSDQWEAWQATRFHNLNGRFDYTIDGTPITYNQCDGTYTDHRVGASIVLPYEAEPEDPSSYDQNDDTARFPYDELDAKYSWIKYDNDFEIHEDTNIIPVSYLEQPTSGYYRDTDGAYANRAVTGMTIGGKTANSMQTNPSVTVDRGHSTFYITMRGHAMRVGYKVPIPFVVTVAGRPAKRVENKVSQKQVSTGDVPVYLAKWESTYVITGGDIYSEDVMNSIVTTGDPGHYA